MDPFDLMCPRHPLPVVKSSNTNSDLDFDESLIDRILGTPDKITIPERYIPETEPELEPEEEQKRSLKAERICRLLSKSNGGNLPLVLPPPKLQQIQLQSANLHKVHGNNGFIQNQQQQHAVSVPNSPARGRLITVKKNSIPNAQVLKRRPNSSSSSLCDWSLAGVLPPSSPQ
jgi:hypothetical protein